jgi:hypothetical protein
MKVFLGGTCNNSTWREELIPQLTIEYYNPAMENWTKEAQQQELHERNVCEFLLYVIVPPMAGYYSIAEVVEDSIKQPHKTIFCVLPSTNGVSFGDKEYHSLTAIKELVLRNGATVCNSLSDVATYLNTRNF